MTFYSAAADTASRLLKTKGQVMFLRRKGVIQSDPVAGTVTTSAPVDISVNGVLVGYSDQLVANGVVQKGDRRAIIEAGVTEPAGTDVLIISGRAWTIINIEQVNPAGTPVLYFLQVRA